MRFRIFQFQTPSVFNIIFSILGKTNELLGGISCRVWKYGDSYGGRSETVTSSAVVGSKNIGLFDHLLAARFV